MAIDQAGVDKSTLDALAAFPDQLEAHYAAIPASFRNWAPALWDGVPSEPFTAIGHICHVRDIEVDGYHMRFDRALRESYPALASLDGMALATLRLYATANAQEVLTEFRKARFHTVSLIASLAPEQLTRRAMFAEYGSVSVRGLVHFLCSHDQQHLAGLQWPLGKIESLTE
jgi:hypothetical protein